MRTQMIVSGLAALLLSGFANAADNPAGEQNTPNGSKPPVAAPLRGLIGQVAQAAAQRAEQEEARMVLRPGRFWIGVGIAPVTDEKRAELKLGDRPGMLVETVVPDSPADKAGVKQGDVLLKAGDRPLAAPDDIVAAVNDSKGARMTIEVFRDGKTEQIAVTPSRRSREVLERAVPAGERALDLMRRYAPELAAQLQAEQGKPGEPLRGLFFGPGIIRGGATPPLPDGVSITVRKTGKDPAQISVTRGDQRWQVTENELDKLPADLRPNVDQMLGHIPGPMPGPVADFRALMTAPPGGPDTPSPPPAAEAPGRGPEARLEQRIDQMGQQIERLSRQLDDLRRSKETPAEPKTSPGNEY